MSLFSRSKKVRAFSNKGHQKTVAKTRRGIYCINEFMNIRRAHFIGIGGVGMSATAKLLKDSGVIVSGSDEDVYSPVLDFLSEHEIPWTTSYAAENIPADIDLIVIGKNAKLVPETNEEVATAYSLGVKVMSFPEVLGELSRDKETIVVVGSYGKSTVTALLAHCMERENADHSFFIGAIPYTPSTSAKTGTGKFFVLEGDEYPSSNTDPRSKFLLMHPSHLLVTPLAHDHFNVFPTPEDYLKPFAELVTLLPDNGVVAVCTEGALSGAFINACRTPVKRVVTYGLSKGDFRAANIEWGETTSFDITYKGEIIVCVETTQLGEHSIQNIVGAAAIFFTIDITDPKKFAESISSFKGLRRRLDKKSDRTSVLIFEGFGSSYEKAKSAIAAMRRHFPERRLIVVFEPHTFGWRNRASLLSYDDVFRDAEIVMLLKPQEHGRGNQEEASFDEIAERIKRHTKNTFAHETGEECLAALDENMRSDDCVLLLSSGPMAGLARLIPELAERKFPK